MPVRIFNNISPTLSDGVFIDSMATVTGDVTLSKDVSIWPNVSIRGDLLPIRIGQNTNIQDNSVIHTTQFFDKNGTGFDVVIGENVTVGHGAIIHGCHIGSRCLIGMGAIILDGAVIEDDVIVGAGSVVAPKKKLESGYLYVGSPAKRIRALTEEEKSYILQNAMNYNEVKNEHINDARTYGY
ncbi:gamma carbonic anhydrase family protein [Fangia hongkongensis]|uniref:gamma carbonic anhydrase family protein n=1 Tax=Fangia hongkongensis TaxID=270495 RepID=UPI00039F6EF1|nr:gamma carbonic anhydrase family protein [Fangia hongkongensis]MBK2124096.1 gamma carbonic anhydrase family protein [Fangia hongkongensis]